MIPLALLAVLIYSTGIQILLFLAGVTSSSAAKANGCSGSTTPTQATGRAGEIIRYTQENVTANKHVRSRFEEVRQTMLHDIERRVIFLNTLVSTAPLMGLLGTVIGMLATFVGLADQRRRPRRSTSSPPVSPRP